MINASPLKRLLVEKEIDRKTFSQIADFKPEEVSFIFSGKVNEEQLDIICKLFNCQPKDVIKFETDCSYCKQPLEFKYCPMCGRKL